MTERELKTDTVDEALWQTPRVKNKLYKNKYLLEFHNYQVILQYLTRALDGSWPMNTKWRVTELKDDQKAAYIPDFVEWQQCRDPEAMVLKYETAENGNCRVRFVF